MNSEYLVGGPRGVRHHHRMAKVTPMMAIPKLPGFPKLLLVLTVLSHLLNAQTTVTFSTSPNPSAFGAPVVLTASVALSNATGRVTFYDGVTVLGTKPLVSGTALLSTILLPTGTRKLAAYYSGDAIYLAGTAGVTQTVKSVAAVGLRTGGSSNFGIRASGMAVGDFNGDGKADLAIPGDAFNGGSTVSILLGNGDGTFQPPAIYPLGLFISSIAIADFNGDGYSDIAVSINDNQGTGLVSMLLGNGDGTFRPAVNFPTVRGPMAVADFNGDGKPDLVLMGSLAGGVILLGNGDGTFRTPLTFQNPYFSSEIAVVVGDFNGDGKPDIAITGPASLQIALGNGDGTFQPFSTASNLVNFGPSFAVGDFNGDGKPDLIASSHGFQSVLLGNGDGTFQPPVSYPIEGYATVGDFNGDGIVDLAIANSNSTTVSLLQGNGDGTFHLASSYTTTTGTSFAMASADFNGDGRADLARANVPQGIVTILLGVASGVSLTTSGGATQSALVRTQYSVPLQVTVVQNGGPVNGATVTFTAPSAGASAVLSSATAVTNAAGIASVTATANDVTGSYVVTGAYQGLTASFSLANTTVASIAATAGTPQSALLGDIFRPLEVTVRDSIGNLASGAIVTFTAPSAGASAVLSSATAVTNSAGIARITVAANGITGSYTVTASTGGLSASFFLTNTKIASVIASGGTPQSTVVGTNFKTQLEVTVRDLEGRPVSSAEVAWGAPTRGASVALNVFPLTNAFGVARATATANNISGSYTVTAFAGIADALSTSFSLTNLPAGTADSVNLALGKTSTSQSSTLSGYATVSAASAVDGSTDGNFFNGSVTHTNFETNPWWQIDLGSSATVNSIVIWNRTDCCSTRLSDYWVFVSDTPFSQTDTPSSLQNRAGIFSSHQTTAPSPSATVQTVGAQGRYVRVQLTGANYLSLAEVQVIGSGVPSVTNLAVGKTATQSSTLPGSGTATAAVDGSTGGNFFEGSVTHTDLSANPWWQVDLGSSATVNSITIWNRTDCCGTRLGDYWVFVSDTPFGPNDTPATLQNRAGTLSSHQTGAPNPSTSIPFGAQGRYVRVQLSGTGYLSLAEVQVLGAGAAAASNQSQGKTAAQSSTLSGSAGPGAAVDGNSDGNFFNGSVTHTNLEANPWWQVDLGASTAIGSIVIWNRTDCCGTRLNDYWVFVSDTPFLPSDTPATLQSRAGTSSSHQTTAPSPSATIAGAQGRYVRVQLTGTNYLSLAEVQVIGQ